MGKSNTRRHASPHRFYKYIHPSTANNAKQNKQRTGTACAEKEILMKAEHVKEEITKNEYLGCKKRYFLVMKREPFYKSRLFSYYFSFPNNSESGVQRPCLPFQNLPAPQDWPKGGPVEVTPGDSAETELTTEGGLIWCLPAGTESQRSQEHLIWCDQSNKHQLWERGGSRICRVKGRALCFLRREDTWVCLIAGEKVPFEKQTGAHKRNNWLE